KTAKRRVRRQIGLGDLSAELHGGDVVSIVQVKKRAVGDGLRQIHGPAAIGRQVYSRGQQMTSLIEANLELRKERMPVTREDHILVPIESHADRAASMMRG